MQLKNRQLKKIWSRVKKIANTRAESLLSWGLKVKVKSLSHIRLFATPWTVVHQAPPSMGFSRQEYWSGLPFPSPWDVYFIWNKMINLCLKSLDLKIHSLDFVREKEELSMATQNPQWNLSYGLLSREAGLKISVSNQEKKKKRKKLNWQASKEKFGVERTKTKMLGSEKWSTGCPCQDAVRDPKQVYKDSKGEKT